MSLARFSKFIDNLGNIESELESSVLNSMEGNEKVIEDRNRERLLRGFDINAKKLTHKRSSGDRPYTKKYSKVKTKVTGSSGFTNVDLKLTGEFHESIEQKKVGLSSYIITSDTDTYTQLKKGYGEDILGYTDSDEQFIIQQILIPSAVKTTKALFNV